MLRQGDRVHLFVNRMIMDNQDHILVTDFNLNFTVLIQLAVLSPEFSTSSQCVIGIDLRTIGRAFKLDTLPGQSWVIPDLLHNSLHYNDQEMVAPSSHSDLVSAAPLKDFGPNRNLDSCLLDNGLQKECKALPTVDGVVCRCGVLLQLILILPAPAIVSLVWF